MTHASLPTKQPLKEVPVLARSVSMRCVAST